MNSYKFYKVQQMLKRRIFELLKSIEWQKTTKCSKNDGMLDQLLTQTLFILINIDLDEQQRHSFTLENFSLTRGNHIV